MSKRPERNFLKPTQISKHLYCSICAEVFLDPMRLFCGHTFCTKCITEWETKNKTCPICRKTIDIGLMGKDLISEKIILDLEVYCVNKLCDWKDRLENLPKHLKNCGFNKTPGWLNQAQNYISLEENAPGEEISMLVKHDDQFIERVNEEVSRKTLLERLYTKNEETKELVNSVFNNTKSKPKQAKGGKGKKGKKGKKEPISKSKSLQDYDDFFGILEDSDEETKEDAGTSDLDSKKDSITSKQAENIEAAAGFDNKSTKDTDLGNLLNEGNNDLIDEAEGSPIGITTRLRSGRKKGKKQNHPAEPDLVKRIKIGS